MKFVGKMGSDPGFKINVFQRCIAVMIYIFFGYF